MKQLYLLILTSCVINVLYGQDQYTFSDSTQVIDLPDEFFLTVNIRNNKVFLQERGLSGNITWSDSLNNSNEIEHLQRFSVERFGLSNAYRFFLQGHYTQDSMLVNHITFSFATHSFSGMSSDTLKSQGYFSTCSINDSTIYLFTNNPVSIELNQHEVLKLTTDGVIETVTTGLETEPVESYGYQFAPSIGGVREVYHNYEHTYSREFGPNMQLSSQVDSLTLVEPYDFGEPLLLQWQGLDSLFGFYYMYNFSASTHSWILAWLTPELEVLHSVENSYFTGPANYPYYVLNFEDVVKTQEFVYLLTYKTDGSNENTRTLFVYDNYLTPVCHFDTQADATDHLVLLNNYAYIRHESENQMNLTRTDLCGVAGLEEKQQSAYDFFPNPSTGKVTIKFHGPINKRVLSVHAVSGALVSTIFAEDVLEDTLEMTLLPGIYMITVDGQSPEKLVIF